jgi:hypothetical protein
MGKAGSRLLCVSLPLSVFRALMYLVQDVAAEGCDPRAAFGPPTELGLRAAGFGVLRFSRDVTGTSIGLAEGCHPGSRVERFEVTAVRPPAARAVPNPRRGTRRPGCSGVINRVDEAVSRARERLQRANSSCVAVS